MVPYIRSKRGKTVFVCQCMNVMMRVIIKRWQLNVRKQFLWRSPLLLISLNCMELYVIIFSDLHKLLYSCIISLLISLTLFRILLNGDDNLFIKIQPWKSEHLRTVNVILWSRQCCDDSIPLLFWTLCFYLITCQSDTVLEEQGGMEGMEGKNILHFLATQTTKYHVDGSDWGKK